MYTASGSFLCREGPGKDSCTHHLANLVRDPDLVHVDAVLIHENDNPQGIGSARHPTRRVHARAGWEVNSQLGCEATAGALVVAIMGSRQRERPIARRAKAGLPAEAGALA
mmetsp:Transcript_16592/g.46126  ORF Transcript_16592/g.46126 Transcript_16592/m.46126 type:complete len:111 (-) Transcript_16592:1246-1578(-)|eukprot:scaffold232204_cov30-Tisochrysis_lutea.AAC.3